MSKILTSIVLLLFCTHLGVAQSVSDRLAIDSNEDILTATLNYNGALVDIFGFARSLDLSKGRLAISVIGPESAQELRILERNTLGLVTQGEPTAFDHLPGFWALHAAPPKASRESVSLAEFEKLPALLQDWSFKKIATLKENNNLVSTAVQAQVFNGRLSVNNQINLRYNGLFNTTLELPAFAPVGSYEIQAHWFDKNGQHLISEPKILVVNRGPLASWVKSASRDQALLFGFICVIVAIAGGLLSEIVFRRFAP